MFNSKEKKQLETFYRVLPLTNWVLLLQKEVFTIEEWSEANKKLTEFFIKKQKEGLINDYEGLLLELNTEVARWDKIGKLKK